MRGWAAANPWTALLLAAAALVTLRWVMMEAWDRVTVDHCDHADCERPEVGDITVSVFEHKRVKREDAGDGVERCRLAI